MTNKANVSSSSGVGFTSLLTVMFIGLKLIGYIDWSWWWVLSPIWISIAVVVAILATVFLILVGKKYLK